MLVDRISAELKLDSGYIINISKRNNLYKRYLIPKKKDGSRIIFHPSKELKILQHWMCDNIFSQFPNSRFAHAYNKGCSIKKNAFAHKENRYFLHTDIVDFFPSITRKHLIDLFSSNLEICVNLELSQSDIDFICDTVLYKGEYLVVGSVVSPQISNNIMYSFDHEINKKVNEEMECVYTRYADDILISSKTYIPRNYVDNISSIMKNYSFSINESKTYFMSKASCRHVTGIVIDNNTGKLSIGNKKYKLFQRELYNYLVKGKGSRQHIIGYLSYIKSIDRSQYSSLVKMYMKYDSKHKIFTDSSTKREVMGR